MKAYFLEPSLDIVTPTLNVGDYISSCLLSTRLLRESFANHLVVDSGSTDGTLEVIQEFGVRSIYHPPQGMYHAVNRGLTESKSEWVTYLNGDDIIYPAEIIKALKCAPEDCDVVYGNIDYIDCEGRFVHYWRSAEIHSFTSLFASTVMPFAQPGTLFRRSLWEKIGGFDEQYKYSGDFDFFLRAFMQGAKFYYWDNMPVAGFRLHGEQISQRFAGFMKAESRMSIEKVGLTVSQFKSLEVMFRMRLRNLDGYVVRFLRNRHMYGKNFQVKTG